VRIEVILAINVMTHFDDTKKSVIHGIQFKATLIGTMTKADILSEIRRTAAENGGPPLGMNTFEKQTGIRRSDWSGVYWRSWGDAVREAGLHVNALTARIEDEFYIERYARLTRELGQVPTKTDLQLAKRRDPTFPSDFAFMNRFGSYATLRTRVHGWCAERNHFQDVAALLAKSVGSSRPATKTPAADANLGFVYLMKHGSRSEYKIGRTQNPIRREGEIRLQLPEKLQPVHYIETDDPSGIEAYWHARFATKRKQGEWFALSADDVRAFKKWKRIS
jgi:hypothetical protein